MRDNNREINIVDLEPINHSPSLLCRTLKISNFYIGYDKTGLSIYLKLRGVRDLGSLYSIHPFQQIVC